MQVWHSLKAVFRREVSRVAIWVRRRIRVLYGRPQEVVPERNQVNQVASAPSKQGDGGTPPPVVDVLEEGSREEPAAEPAHVLASVSETERVRRRYDKFLEVPKGAAPKRTGHRVAKPAVPVATAVEQTDFLGVPLYQETKEGDLARIGESELYGEFNFRDTILDQLDRYFVFLRRMYRHDRCSYDLYRQVGATLLPYSAVASDKVDLQFLGQELEYKSRPSDKPKLPPHFVRNMPAFGCFAYGTDTLTEERERQKGTNNKNCWIPKFLYFCKYRNPPPEIQPASGGCVYVCTIWYDRLDKVEAGRPACFAVLAQPDGSVRVLKILVTDQIQQRVKKGKDRGTTFSIPRKAWMVPDVVDPHEGETKTESLERLFCNTAAFHEAVHGSMFRVSVTRGKLTATFSLNAKRSPYFFADRDLQVNQDGVKRRIFHIVRPHKRVLASGKEIYIKLHYRGARKFTWAGYEVLITVPGLHHIPLSEFDVGSVDSYWADKRADFVTNERMGRWLSDMIRGHGFTLRR